MSVLATWLRVSLAEASCERLQPLFGVHGWAFPSGPLQLSSESLTRLLPAAHWWWRSPSESPLADSSSLARWRLPVSILLIANSVIKSIRSIQSSTTVTKISMQTIVTIAGGVEPAESSTIAGSAKGYSTRGSCEDTGPLWHRHVFQSSFGSLAGRKKDEANVPVSTCSMPASSSSTRRPRGPDARMDQNVYVSMTTRRVRSTRRKNLRLQDRPRFELGNKQKSLWGKKIYPAVWWVLGLPLVAA